MGGRALSGHKGEGFAGSNQSCTVGAVLPCAFYILFTWQEVAG